MAHQLRSALVLLGMVVCMVVRASPTAIACSMWRRKIFSPRFFAYHPCPPPRRRAPISSHSLLSPAAKEPLSDMAGPPIKRHQRRYQGRRRCFEAGLGFGGIPKQKKSRFSQGRGDRCQSCISFRRPPGSKVIFLCFRRNDRQVAKATNDDSGGQNRGITNTEVKDDTAFDAGTYSSDQYDQVHITCFSQHEILKRLWVSFKRIAPDLVTLQVPGAEMDSVT